ncbi:MAG: nickel pincer cofactor biosynthesis protein LarB [Candidatus Altiarchaeales archaeon]|nr:nickel pincer cofactor biosynthesis protein LarB [Candidatus Altiarchaeales archaeon]MBD3416713.1 nickel pincer cofactor biosynthesis protein LarB [Candidatus Altiarchaeales archaeon]
MKIVEPDFERMERCGIPEIVYGQGKSKEQLLSIAETFLERAGRVIVTKVNPEKAKPLLERFTDRDSEYNEDSGVLVLKKRGFKVEARGKAGIITAGTSDIGVAEEARTILEELGCESITAYDVGVAGVHRVYPALEKMTEAQVLIVVAGMEGALPSVVSGLVDVPVIGVPTSVGYGVGRGGRVALNAMLTSCTPVAVVNIDNGYGAAVLAYQIIR